MMMYPIKIKQPFVCCSHYVRRCKILVVAFSLAVTAMAQESFNPRMLSALQHEVGNNNSSDNLKTSSGSGLGSNTFVFGPQGLALGASNVHYYTNNASSYLPADLLNSSTGLKAQSYPDASGSFASIQLTAPTQTSYYGHDYLSLAWQSTGIDSVKVEYNFDGNGWMSPGIYGASSTLTLAVPNITSSSCYVRVSDANNAGVYDQRGPITITPLHLALISPNGGEKLKRGAVFPITWSTNKPNTSAYRISYSADNGENWTVFYNSYAKISNSYNWTVPVDLPLGKYKIKLQPFYAYAVMDDAVDVSDEEFSIICTDPAPVPTLTVQCDSTILESMAPPLGTSYFWQTTAMGTDVANNNLRYRVTTSGTYYLRARDNASGCWGEATPITVTVQTSPQAPVLVGPNSAICNGTSFGVSVPTSAQDPLLRWQSSTDGITWSTWMEGGNRSFYTATNKTTSFRSVFQGGCGIYYSQPLTVTINPLPSAPAEPSITQGCGNAVLTTAPAPPGTTSYWQNSYMSTDRTDSSLTKTVTTNGTYYVRIRNNTTGCWSSPTPKLVTLNTAPPSISAPGSVCEGSSLTLTLTGEYSGSILYWQSSTDNGANWTNISSTASSLLVDHASVSTLYRTVLQTDCGIYNSNVFTLVVKPRPETPVVDIAFGWRCGPGSVYLAVSGGSGNYFWYSSDTATEPFATNINAIQTPLLDSTTTYFASSQWNGCESERTEVIARIKPLPEAPVVPAVTAGCGSATLTRTTSPQEGSDFWQSSPDGTDFTNGAQTYTVYNTATYYVRTYNFATACWSPATSVQVTIPAVLSSPDLPSVYPDCDSAILMTALPPEGISYYWQTTSTGTDTSNSSIKNTVRVSGTYYLRARQNAGGCWSEATAVTVTVKQAPPSPSLSGPTNSVCGLSPITVSLPADFSGTVESWQYSHDGGRIWRIRSNQSTDPHILLTSFSGSYSSNTEYLVRAKINAECGFYYSQPLVVTVLPLVSVPSIVNTESLCFATRLTTSQPPAGSQRYWQTTANGTSSDSAINFTAYRSGSYYLRNKDLHTGCWSASRGVTVSVNMAAPTITGPLSVCPLVPINLTLSSFYSGSIVSWQQSYDGVDWYTFENASGPSLSMDGLTASTTFRVKFNDPATCGIYYSEPFRISVLSAPQTPPIPTITGSCSSAVLKTIAAPSGQSYFWQTSALGTETSSGTDTYTVSSSGTYYLRAFDNTSGCWSKSTSIAVTLGPPPAPEVERAGRCGEGSVTLTAIGTGSSYRWYDSNDDFIDETITSTYTTPALSGTTQYKVSAVNNGCEGAKTLVTATVLTGAPANPIIYSSPDCNGTAVLKMVSGGSMPDLINYWQSSPDATSTANSNLVDSVKKVGTYYLRTYNSPGQCWSPPSFVTVTMPAGQPVAPASLSGYGSVTLKADPVIPYIQYWFSSANSTNIDDAISPTVTTSGTYYLRGKDSYQGCWTLAQPVAVTILDVCPPTATGGSRKGPGSVTLTATGSASLFRLYTTSTGGTPLQSNSTGIFLTPVLEQTTTFYISSVNQEGYESSSRTPVTAIILPDPITQNRNMIITNTLLKEGIKDETQISGLSVEDNAQSISYIDGLGRPIQNVVVQGSASRQDIVQIFSYDPYGRQTRKFLPFTGGNDGFYKDNAFNDLSNFYNSSGPRGDRATTTRPFAETMFEASPRAKSTRAGLPWRGLAIGRRPYYQDPDTSCFSK